MTRKPRIDAPGIVHHVHNRGARRQAVFLEDRDRRSFLQLLGDALSRHHGTVHAYCLMGNHFHLLVRTEEGDLDRVMQLAMSRYVRRFNSRHGLDGPLFTDRYSNHLVEDDQYAVTLLRYIHRNPSDIEGVDISRYPWSSLRAFVNPRLRQPWLDTEWGLAYFSGDGRAFLRFVLGDPAAEPTNSGNTEPRNTDGAGNDVPASDECRRLLLLVAKVAGQNHGDLIRRSSGRKAPERVLLAHLAVALLETERAAAAAQLGYRDAQTLAAVASRFADLAPQRPDLRAKAEAVMAVWRNPGHQRGHVA